MLVLLACSPALANERAEQEANLVALSAQVVKVMEAYVPQVEGVSCVPKPLPENWALEAFAPLVQSNCDWVGETGEQQAVFQISFNGEQAQSILSSLKAEQAAIAGEEPPEDAGRFYEKGDAIANVQVAGSNFVLTPWLSGIFALNRRGTDGPPDTLDALAQAIVGMDGAALMALPEAQAYIVAMADHRRLLESHRPLLAAMLPLDVEGRDPAQTQPDHDRRVYFYYAQPTAEAKLGHVGVEMDTMLITSSVQVGILEGYFSDASGPKSLRFDDRGRVRVLLGDDGLIALIGGRGLLDLRVVAVPEGADPVAAMEAVLAQVAMNDFSGF